MAIEAGRVILTANGIKSLDFDFSVALGDEIIVGTPTIEIIKIEGDDVIGTLKPHAQGSNDFGLYEVVQSPSGEAEDDEWDIKDKDGNLVERRKLIKDVDLDPSRFSFSDYGSVEELKAHIEQDSAFKSYNFDVPHENSVEGAIDKDTKQSVSVVVRAKPQSEITLEGAGNSKRYTEKILRGDGSLDSIWEVICRIRTAPGGMTDSGSMIVVGAG